MRLRLALTLNLTGDTRPEARTVLNELLQEQVAAHAENSPSHALALRHLSSVEVRSAHFHEGLVYAEQALASARNTFGNDAPAVGEALNQLGNAETNTGLPKQAAEHFMQAREIFQRYGMRALAVGMFYNSAIVYNEQLRDLKKAEEYARSAAAGFGEVLGKGSNNVLIAEGILIDVLMQEHRYDEAQQLLERSLHFWEKVDPTLENMGPLWGDMAVVRHAQGRDDEARKLLEQALPPLDKYTDPDSHYRIRAHALAKQLHMG